MAARPLHSHSSGPREDRATLLVLVSVPWQLVSLNELVELGARCSLGSGSWLQQHAPHRLTWRARAGLVLERSLPARAALVVLSVRSGGSSTASGAVIAPSYFMWIDADAVVVNHSRTVDDVLALAGCGGVETGAEDVGCARHAPWELLIGEDLNEPKKMQTV